MFYCSSSFIGSGSWMTPLGFLVSCSSVTITYSTKDANNSLYINNKKRGHHLGYRSFTLQGKFSKSWIFQSRETRKRKTAFLLEDDWMMEVSKALPYLLSSGAKWTIGLPLVKQPLYKIPNDYKTDDEQNLLEETITWPH